VGIFSFFRRVKNGVVINDLITDDAFENAALEYCIRDLCLWSSINLIAGLVGKCEFRTFTGGKETRDAEHYLWNVEPNRNQNSTQFLRKLITRLYLTNEALVVEVNGQLLVADSFARTPYALYDHQFSGVTVEGFTFAQTFYMADVLYFQLSERNMRQVIDRVHDSYNRMLKYAATQYQRSRGSRGILKLPNIPSGSEEAQNALADLLNNKFKRFFTANSAVLPLPQGYSYEDSGGKTYANETTRDIRAMIDDISDFTARAFGIPPALMRGTVEGTKDAMNTLLTVTIDPLTDMLQEEINRKRSGLAGMRKGTYVRIDTKTVQHIDLLSVAGSIDKLIGSGVFCVNDIRRACGETEIDAPWARQHMMTKNYAPSGELNQALGEGNGDGKTA